ncbi:MAG: deoxyribose-phosphate aldolase [Candidatus Pacebacteria bacterium]|nr:deoxyribose-phosphate aldolase [Candidatus Paceibacterota bacterium]
MDKQKLAGYLDFANHRADATEKSIRFLCQQVKAYGFHSAFVNPCYVPLAKELLGEEGVVGTVIGFPLGQEIQAVKVFASVEAAKKRADELDVSMNVGWFKAGWDKLVLAEMRAIVEAVRNIREKTIIKFIIETGFLNEAEIKKAAELVVRSGADFVKTCSGMGPRGARLRDVVLIRSAIGDQAKIKVAGGIGTCREAIAFIEAGARQIGTSKAVEILDGLSEAKRKESVIKRGE